MSGFHEQIAPLQNKHVAVAASGALELALLLLLLDGWCKAILVIPFEAAGADITSFGQHAGTTLLVTDRNGSSEQLAPNTFQIALDVDRQNGLPGAPSGRKRPYYETSWIIPTSGTTSTPKLVAHTFRTLTRSIKRREKAGTFRWGLLYDLTRFAGLQVLLQSLLRGEPLIFTDVDASLNERLSELADGECSALSATPSMWRQILMSRGGRNLPLRQITLGGETADANILAALSRGYPDARITHIYASTEAGVGFAVHDGEEGFPASYITTPPDGIELSVDGRGHLLVRTTTYRPSLVGTGALHDDDGWIDTGDVVRREGSRYLFLGRDSGVINVGGRKVFPEEVERTIYQFPGVAWVNVRGRRSSIVGSVVEAVLVPEADNNDHEALAKAVKQHCVAHLPNYKVPAIVRIAESLDVTPTGKLARN